MPKLKILILGSTGFFGRNLVEEFKNSQDFEIVGTSRNLSLGSNDSTIFFDYTIEKSWESITELKPDIIINAAGYGVVKYESDLQLMYDINYMKPVKLVEFIIKKQPEIFWLQIGTAFEYDLGLKNLTEQSICSPKTHYGISKWMFSHFLLNNHSTKKNLLIRPFGMFGPYEDESKIFPYLIYSQLEEKLIALSSGTQVRDYIYVKDVTKFIVALLQNNKYLEMPKIINAGSGAGKKLREMADILSLSIAGFKPELWQWNKIPQRGNESDSFINSSHRAASLGLKVTPYEEAFLETFNYYKEKRTHV